MKQIRSYLEKKMPIHTNCQAERNRLMQKREWLIERMVEKAEGRELTGDGLNELYRQVITGG